MNLEKIRKELREFAKERDWEKFHTPKNLASALSVVAAELLEIFQWSKEGFKELKGKQRESIEDEIADILNYLIRLSDVCDINLEEVSLNKIKKNHQSYPVNLAKGNSKKYTDL